MSTEPGAGSPADPTTILSALLSAVELSSTAQNRFAAVEQWISERLDLPRAEVRATYVSEPKMVAPRLSTPGIVRARPRVVVAAIGAEPDVDTFVSAIKRKMSADDHLRTVLVALRPHSAGPWRFPSLLSTENDAIVDGLHELLDVNPETVASEGHGAYVSRLAAGVSTPVATVVVDDRIRRMARHSIATARAVVLIGPPGTGKTTLVREVLADLASDPSRYGLTRPPHSADPVTPDDSWSASDIVGGPTVHDGEIVFRAGHVLRAIRDDHSLFLDEANRADLDKILGGLLTWMSGQEVVVGRLTEAVDSPLITVGWNDAPESRVVNRNLLDDPTATPANGDGPVRFLAGREWRLLATYNAVDAQRVFRFGEALGRRFAKVPVPPPDVIAVSELIAGRCMELGLSDEIAVRIVALYEAHQGAAETVLGPASFLDMTAYVASLQKSGDADMSELGHLEAAVAESYLAQVGLTLARLEEDELDRLGDRAGHAGGLGAESWAWVRTLLPALRG